MPVSSQFYENPFKIFLSLLLKSTAPQRNLKQGGRGFHCISEAERRDFVSFSGGEEIQGTDTGALHLNVVSNKYHSSVLQSFKDASVEYVSTNTSVDSTQRIVKQIDVSANGHKAML
jgi:hypothetical protein